MLRRGGILLRQLLLLNGLIRLLDAALGSRLGLMLSMPVLALRVPPRRELLVILAALLLRFLPVLVLFLRLLFVGMMWLFGLWIGLFFRF